MLQVYFLIRWISMLQLLADELMRKITRFLREPQPHLVSMLTFET